MTNFSGIMTHRAPLPALFGADTIVVYDRATTNHTGKFKRCVCVRACMRLRAHVCVYSEYIEGVMWGVTTACKKSCNKVPP